MCFLFSYATLARRKEMNVLESEESDVKEGRIGGRRGWRAQQDGLYKENID